MNSEIVRYRMVLANGMLGVPAWGYVLAKLEPGMFDPMWIRWMVSFTIGLFLIFSFKVINKKSFLEKCVVIGGWLTILHSWWLGYHTHFPISFFCGYLILLTALLNSFPTTRSTMVLAIANSLVGAVVAFYPENWITSPLLFNVSIWTILIVSVSGNFTRLGHLHSLTEVQRKMNFLLNKMQDGLILYGENHMPTYANPTASKLLGFSLEQLMQMQINQFKIFNEDGKHSGAAVHPALQAFQTGQDISKLIGIERPDGSTIWVKAFASPFKSEDTGTSVLVTISDLSEVRRNHKIIVEQQKQLEATAKLTALGEVAAGVAHEINNPLAIIVGKVYNIERAINTNKTSEPIMVSLAKINQTVDRIRKIVKGLQTFANGGDKDPLESLEVKDIIADAVTMCQQKITETRVKVNVDVIDDCLLECRRNQITQCLINLIYNSCDAVEHLDNRWINLWARSAHQSIVITITDSGSGIPDSIREKLMQPFYTTKDPGRGTGLGLSIARGLVQSHMGRLWYDSNCENTRFIIDIPIVQSVKKLVS